ncbi:hypothetical protein DFJ58DRAFT_837967 [Suillus subalutaceus]|uniref:uncharacterized protein n=1 Tax=Suillus subalutaceus TaxID=48586 RepID=UPI001B87116D|nr:uncharacterized protein DFJ58DRAFT_837967 [Suillus subalutaceus]KAG1868328.1 hypothetical protein DFJ58DRAFT_837967 [Suillus subalutaceus]
MSQISPESCSYSNHADFLRNGVFRPARIPQDWALHTTNVASEWVEQQFLAHIAGWPLVNLPPKLDMVTMLSCGQLALRMAHAYQHSNIDIIRYNEALAKRESGMNDAQEEALLTKFPPAENIFLDTPSVVMDSGFRVILWYIPDGLSPWVQNDMYAATVSMGDLLKKSVTTRKGSGWRTHESNFRPAELPGLTPGCINIALCWFQQGHECYGPPPNNPEDGFKPEVSATLKGERSLSMIMDMQRPALLASAALRVMHPQLYWASAAAVMCNHQSPNHRDPKCLPEAFDILTSIGSYRQAIMKLPNLGIELAYNPGVMVSYLGRLVRHGIRVDEGDRIVWSWFLRDSVHNYARTPRPDYARYNPADLNAYKLAKYNQANFTVYGKL